MHRLHSFRFGLAPGKRIAIACATLALLLAGASAIAYHSYSKARELTEVARQDRQDALTAERAISEFWRERESIGEYLVIPSQSLGLEVQHRQQAFQELALQTRTAASQESRREGIFFARALKANAALVASAQEPRFSRPGDLTTAQVLEALQDSESSVLDPLHTVYRLNQSQYQHREALARSASSDALHIEIGSALLVLAGIGWFAVFAFGLVRRVDTQNAALRNADELKDEFINTVSHELRTPITSIQGYLELLLDTEGDGADPLTEEQRRFLETVTRSSERLLHLVNDLLLVAQARAGRLEMNKAPCDLVEVARHAVESALAAAAKNGITLRLQPMVSRALVSADAPRLGQAIDNLVSNAIKFTPEGGTVEVGVSQAESRSLITIADTGAGMSRAEVDQLFERFFRTRSAREGNIQGTGLGLAITKSIVEAHGGTITVSSEAGVGTTFTIVLAAGPGATGADTPRQLRTAGADAPA